MSHTKFFFPFFTSIMSSTKIISNLKAQLRVYEQIFNQTGNSPFTFPTPTPPTTSSVSKPEIS
jgi:hypothetical protein